MYGSRLAAAKSCPKELMSLSSLTQPVGADAMGLQRMHLDELYNDAHRRASFRQHTLLNRSHSRPRTDADRRGDASPYRHVRYRRLVGSAFSPTTRPANAANF